MPPDRFAKDEVVERGDAIQILGCDLEKLCNLEERVIRNPATPSLDDQQGIDGSPPLVRVMLHCVFKSRRSISLSIQLVCLVYLVYLVCLVRSTR